MVSRQDATLNLASLLKRSPIHGGEDEVFDEGLLTPRDEVLSRDDLKLVGPLSWQLTVRATGGDREFLLEGEVSGTVNLECRRCLTEVQEEVASYLFYPMLYKQGAKGLTVTEQDEEEVLVFGQPEVDFSELLAEVVALDVPLTALCKEDCKGLSPEGINLNEHPEAAGEKKEERESPFRVLKDLEL